MIGEGVNVHGNEYVRCKLMHNIFGQPSDHSNSRSVDHASDAVIAILETRRLRGDQIEVFKILNGYENIDSFFLKLRKVK